MLTQITFYPILGLPLIAWGGMFTLLCFILTALIGSLNKKGIIQPPLITLKGHTILAWITLVLALGHAILGLLAFL